MDLNVAIDAFSRVLPVLLLVGLGALFRRQQFLSPAAIDGLRKLVLNVTLPAALFLAFLNTDLEAKYAVIVICVFLACLVVLLAGPYLRRGAGVRSEAMPSLMAGFEAGMIGYALFAAIFGQAALSRFAIVDLGQVIFVFFVLAPVVMRWASGKTPPLTETLTAFVRTPVIIAIVAGVAGSLFGLGETLGANAIGSAGLETLVMLAAVTTPAIAIVIGYSTKFSAGSLSDPARTLAVRLPIWIVLALLFNWLVIDSLLGLDRLFQAAVMMMAILPPPFVVPLYMARARGRDVSDDPDHDYLANTLSLATVVTLVAATIVGVVYVT
jgi:predicted permease